MTFNLFLNHACCELNVNTWTFDFFLFLWSSDRIKQRTISLSFKEVINKTKYILMMKDIHQKQWETKQPPMKYEKVSRGLLMKEFCDNYKIVFIPAHRPQLRAVLKCWNFPHFCTDYCLLLTIKKFKSVPSSDLCKKKPQQISVVADDRNITFFSKYFGSAIMVNLQLDPIWTSAS